MHLISKDFAKYHIFMQNLKIMTTKIKTKMKIWTKTKASKTFASIYLKNEVFLIVAVKKDLFLKGWV